MATDLALGLLRHGYRAIERDREQRAGGDTYPSRLLGRRAVVLRSEAGVRAFYDESLVERSGAVPPPVKNLIFGRGGVQGLDGPAHRGRKQVFLDLLTRDRVDALAADVALRLRCRSDGWAADVDPFTELAQVYGAAVAAWSGCAPSVGVAHRLASEFAAIVDGFGGAGLAFARGWAGRLRTNRWLRQRVAQVRSGARTPPPGSALAVVAARADLPTPVAAVELGNLLRPTVAVAWFGASAAWQLAASPSWRERLDTAEVGPDHLAFAHEVRRHLPFAPVLAGVARRGAVVDGVPVTAGDRLVLDVYGVDSDPSGWQCPAEFAPERFVGRSPGPYEMVPQGGGDPHGHRCPGEYLANRLLAETARVLAGVPYRVVGDGEVDLSRIPTVPSYRIRVPGRVGSVRLVSGRDPGGDRGAERPRDVGGGPGQPVARDGAARGRAGSGGAGDGGP